MNSDWKTYLDAQNIAHDNDASDIKKVIESTVLCDLSQFGTLVIAGDDAASFMQGQFTNDVDMVNEDSSQLNGFCNRKGRMLANFRLFKYQGNYFASIKNDLIELSIQHLESYILRSQVALQDVSEQLIHIGVSGDKAAELLSPFIGNISKEIDSVSHNEDYIAIRVAGLQPRYEIFCSVEHAKTLWQKLSTQTDIVNSSVWDYQDIQAGIPFIDSHTSGEFIPQMANMELINGVSFTKGCFTGQEIVARTHYLGKQKRRTYRIKIVSDTKPKAGDQLVTETSTDNQYTGTLITIYPTANNEYEALAVIQIKSAEEGKLKLKNTDSNISLLELPYSLENKDESTSTKEKQ